MRIKAEQIKYEPEDDVLNVFLSDEKIEDSYEVEPHCSFAENQLEYLSTKFT